MIAERTQRFEAWIAPMRARAQPWRVGIGVVLAGAVWLPAVALALSLARTAGLAPDQGAVVAFLLTFGVLPVVLGHVMRRLHHLPGARLLGPEERLEGAGVLRGILFVAVIAGILTLPAFGTGMLQRQHPVGAWLLWLPAALPAVVLQAAAEEIVFRGYLQTMLAARFASRWIWWFIPALLFGLLHWNPALGGSAWLMVAAALLMGLVFGDIAARTGGLALPVGLHFANNAFALLVVATPSPLSGLALFLSPVDMDDPAAMRAALIGNILLIAALWGIYLLIVRLRRR